MKLLQLSLSRMIAGALAAGGCFWGLLVLPLILLGDNPSFAMLVLGPGYLVTFGYLVRVFGTPPIRVRVLIWIASLVVQGGWLAYVGGSALIAGRSEPPMPVAWWAASTLLSAIALAYESDTEPMEQPEQA